MFRGHYTATVDERGRVKLPAAFLDILRENLGDELFATSLDGSSLRIYPLQVWLKIEERLKQIPSMSPVRNKLMDRFTFYGQMVKLDKMGRLLIPQRLRSCANLDGNVVVLGFIDYLEIWNPEDFEAKLEQERLSNEDLELLSELGI